MKRVMTVVLCMCAASMASAGRVLFQAEAPVADPLDIAFLTDSTTDQQNVAGDLNVVNAWSNDAATYVANDRTNLGQTFTTGAAVGGYLMKGFWLKHVLFESTLTNGTWWDVDNAGAVLTFRVSQVSGTALTVQATDSYTITGTEPGNPGANPGAEALGTGTWIYFEFSTPVALAGGTQYAIDVSVTAGGLFMETAGVIDDQYTAGSAFTTASKGATDMGTVWAGDHTFMIDNIAIQYAEPADDATAVPVDQDLLWAVVDSNAEYVDLYFGTEDDPNLSAKAEYKKLSMAPAATVSYDPGTMPFNTTYYWRVDAYEPNTMPGASDYVVIPGQVCNFTTVPAVPVFNVNPGRAAVFEGETAQLTATCSSVTALTGPVQWFRVAAPDVEITAADPDISIVETNGGLTVTSTLSIAHADLSREGQYYAVATNEGGFAGSTNGAVTIKRLMAHYPFEGDPNDASGNDLDGVAMSAGTAPNNVLPSYAAGKVGQAVSLSNVYANYIDLPDDFADFKSGLTLTLWANPTVAGSWTNFIQFSNGAPMDNIFFCRSGTSSTLHFRTANGASQNTPVEGLAAISLNQWQMFTATMDASGVMRLYKNGARYFYYNSDGTTNTPQVTSPLPDVITRINNYIGRSAWADSYFTGLMDEVRIYNYALSDDEVADLYFADSGEPACLAKPTADLSGDCRVDLADLGLIAEQWLNCGYYPAELCN